MTMSSEFIVNGVPITFTAFGWGIDGITIHPDVYNDHEPHAIATAIEYASGVWTQYRDYAWVLVRRNIELTDFVEPTKEAALENYETCQRAINGEIFILPESAMAWAKQSAKELLYYSQNGCYPYVPQVSLPKPTRQPKKGYIYLLKAVTPDNHYKIGLSKEPVTRIESMGVKLPFPVETLHTFETDDMTQTEKILHGRFADKRVNGEWFELETGDVAYIQSISGWFGGEVYHD